AAVGRFSKPSYTPTTARKTEMIDVVVALEMVGGDVEALRGVIETFLGECGQLVSALAAAVTGKDGSALHRAAHTIKGAVAMFGAEAVRRQALQLETMGRHNEFAGATEACAALQRDMERVVQELRELLRHETSPAQRR